METPFGRYLLVERLGTGSLTEAYRAKSFGVEGFEKAIVVKRVLPNLAALPGLLDAFVERAKASLSLSHANVVQVIDLGRVAAELPGERGAREHTFIATELVTGTDLGTLLEQAAEKRVALPVGLALFVAAEIAKALEHAHKRRSGAVVHGPLTPRSVLVSREGEIKVSDFAIHRALTAIRFAPDEARTLPHLSPEELRGEEPGPASDVFSLGSLLFELLTGRRAFAGADADATRSAIASGRRPAPSRHRGEIGKEIDALVARMLAIDPAQRFGDAAGAHEELVALGYSLGVSPSHVEVAELATRLVQHVESAAHVDEHVSLLEVTPAPASVARATMREATFFCATGLDGAPDRAAILRRVEGAGGIVHTSDGAEVRAVFGLHEADGRDTEAAVRLGLDLVAGASELSIGVDVGRVTADEAGGLANDVELASSFALAARLAASRRGQVRLSRAASRAVEREIELEADAGGEDASIAKAARARRAPSTRFVGRRAELERLGVALGRALRGEATAAFVSGDRGAGKTRLVNELERRLGKLPSGAQIAYAVCPRDFDGAGAPLSAVAAVARSLFGAALRADEAPAATAEKRADLSKRLRALGLDEADTTELADLASSARAAQSEESVSRSFGRALAKASRDRPVALVLDDCHAIDPASARVLGGLLGEPEARRLFLVFAGRSLTEPLADRAEAIPLGPLSDADVAVLAANLLGARVLPPELVTHLAARAEGNPLFVELIVKELTDGARVTVRQGVAQVDLEGAGVPRTLRALVEGRLARLSEAGGEDARDVLRAMAVLGDEATEMEIAGLVELPVERVVAARKKLDERGLTSGSRLESVLAEVVLETIPEDERRRAHARAAQIVESLGETSGDRVDRVAAHLFACDDRVGAARRFARAAAWHATSSSSPFRAPRADLAARSAARALSVAPLDAVDAVDLAGWLGTLADAVVRSRVRVGFTDLAATVLDRIDRADDATLRVTTRLDVARIAAAESSFEQAEVVLSQARELATQPELVARSLAAEVELAERSGDVRRGADAAAQLLALGDVADARVLLDAATLFASSLALDQAQRAVELAYEIALTDNAALRASVESRRGRVLLVAGDAAGAQRASLLAADLADAHSLSFEVASAKLTLADAHLALERPERAYSAFVEALEAAEGGGHERLGVLARGGLAYLDGLRSRSAPLAGAETALARFARETEARGFAADALVLRLYGGRLLLSRDREAEARGELERVEKVARELGHLALARDAAAALARAAR